MYSVVIIDDNKLAVDAITAAADWNAYDCQVVGTAYDGIAGLQLIRELLPQIVIIDIQMPGFNGLDVIRKMINEEQEMQFIIVSGYGQFEYAQQAIRYGVSDYLLKPVMVDEMESALQHVVSSLDKKRKERTVSEMDGLEKKLYEIRAAKSQYSAMVVKAMEYVSENLNKNISQPDVCKELLISTGHFSKCFKKETGVGFAAYVTMVKMENARILLKNPKNRVNEVARMLGYSDYAYFFQVFKKQFGYAPSDIKANVKKDMEDKTYDSNAGE